MKKKKKTGKGFVSPLNLTSPITDNKTTKNGGVVNRCEVNAEMAKREVDNNHK